MPRNYPVRGDARCEMRGDVIENDPRFTIGLVLAVREELERRGYPELDGLDIVDLQQLLFRFIYSAREGVTGGSR